MPVMNGYEATKAIRESDDASISNVQIIAMTANAFKEDEIAAEKAGMQSHIAKPIDVEKMLNTIAEVMKKAKAGQ